MGITMTMKRRVGTRTRMGTGTGTGTGMGKPSECHSFPVLVLLLSRPAAQMRGPTFTIVVRDPSLGSSIGNVLTCPTRLFSEWRRRHGCGACLFPRSRTCSGCITWQPERQQIGTNIRRGSMWKKNGVMRVCSSTFVFLITRATMPTETLDEHHEQCHQDYICKSGEDISTMPSFEQRAEVQAWQDELDSWWTQCEVSQAHEMVCTGQCYKVMLDLHKELSKKGRCIYLSFLSICYLTSHHLPQAQFMLQRFQLKMIVTVVTGAADDPMARNASFVVAGST